MSLENIVQEIATENQALKMRLQQLEAQFAASEMANQTMYQALAGETIETPTFTGTIIHEDPVKFKDDIVIESGDNDVTISKIINERKIDIAGDTQLSDGSNLVLKDGDNDTTISKTTDVDEIEYSGNLKVVIGKFAATSIYVGDLIISEDSDDLMVTEGNVKVHYTSAAGLVGYTAAETGSAIANANFECGYEAGSVFGGGGRAGAVRWVGDGANCHLYVESDAGDIIFETLTVAQIRLTDGKLYPVTDNDIDLGDATHAWKNAYFEGQVNFAGGTTYKIEADGDATFKHITATKLSYSGATKPYISFLETDVANTYGPYINLGRESANLIGIIPYHDANGKLTYLKIQTVSDQAVSTAGFGDIAFFPDNVEKFRIKADGAISLPYLGAGPASMANGDIWMEADGLHIYYNGAEKVVAGV